MSSAAIPIPTQNPIDDEIKQAHGSLSPEAQKAVSMAIGGNIQPPSPPGIAIPPQIKQAAPGIIQGPGGQSPEPNAKAPVGPPRINIPEPEGMAPAKNEVQRLTIPTMDPATGKPMRSSQNQSGIDQIHHAGIRIPLQVLDAIGSGLFPNIAMGIPGTGAHHQLLVNRAENAEAQQESQANETAKRGAEGATQAHTEAETGAIPTETELKKAETERARAQATAAGEKPTNEWVQLGEPVTDPKHPELGAQPAFFNKNDPSQGIVFGNAPVAAKPTEKTPSVHVLPDGTVISVHGDEAKVVYKGDPKVRTEVKQIEINGKPHQVLHNADTGEVIKDLGESGEKPPVVNVNAETNRADRSYDKRNAELTAIGKPVSDLNMRLGRLQDTLAQNSPQADALVAPELLTVMAGGMGSGLRMNEAEIARIVGGRSKWESLKAAINQWQLDPKKARSITPEQQQQIRALTNTVASKLTQKQEVMNDAYRALAATDDIKEHRKIIDGVRSRFSEIDAGKGENSTPTVKTKEDFDKLAPGAVYIGKDGQQYQKPK